MEAERGEGRPFDLQGHRGARGLRPENTIEGFAHALSLGVSTLELDTAITRDGVVVVSHDWALNPDITRDPAGLWIKDAGPTIFSMTFAELQRFDVGRLRPGTSYAQRFPDQRPIDGSRIPRLADVFALVERRGHAKVRFNIETKLNPHQAGATPSPLVFVESLVREIRLASMEQRATIQSFDWRTLNAAQKIAPEIAIVCLTTQGRDDNVGFDLPFPSPWLGGLDARDFSGSVPSLVKAAGARIWSPDRADVSGPLVMEAHSLGLQVIPWTVNEPSDMAVFIDMGADGLITDRPDVLRRVLLDKGRSVPEPHPNST